MRTRVFGAVAVAVAAVELLLCFVGPIAFVQRPSLLLYPLFSHGLDRAELREVTSYLEREIALTNSYTITSRDQLEDYLVRSGLVSAAGELQPVDYREARRISAELGLTRFAVGLCFATAEQVELSVKIRNVADEEVIRSGRFIARSLEDLLQGVGSDGRELRIGETLSVETKGVGLTDWLVLLVLAAQAAVGIIAIRGQEPGILVELTWAPALVLFVFAWVYARNANMDYVQRFIAHQGRLRLAASTATEQLYTLLRFGPLLVLDGAYYALRRARESGGPWVRRIITRWALPWSGLSAVLYALSFPSDLRLRGLGFQAWFALVPLFVVLATAPPARGVFYGTFFGALQALIVNYWHGTYSYVTLHVIIIVLVAEYLVFMTVLVATIRLSRRWGWLTAPALWSVFDYLRSIGILGYPWGLAGASQHGFVPLIQIASVTGVWGVGFLVLLVNAAVAWVLLDPRRRAPLAVGAAAVGASVIFGLVRLGVLDRAIESTGAEPATVVLLQPNIDPRKHAYRDSFDRSVALTDRAMEELDAPPDLVVWPESGFPLDLGYWSGPERRGSEWGSLVQEFRDYQRQLGIWLVTGTQDHRFVVGTHGEEQRINYNSSVLLDPEGEIRGYYHKVHLVPFTEYFPLDEERFSWLHEIFQKFDISDWGVGDRRSAFDAGGLRFVTPICFEDVFPDDVRRYLAAKHGSEDVDAIINISNDYWSLSPVEGTQHGLLALFRAVENARPLLRSTASGYTVHVDAAGRIRGQPPAPYTPGYLIAEVEVPEGRTTIYRRLGDWFPLLCALGLAVAGLVAAIRSIIRITTRRRTP